MSMCGGTGALNEANAEIQGIVDKVRADMESKEGRSFPLFKAVSYKSQLVAGTNYFIKVQVDESEYAHLRVYQTLPHAGSTLELNDYKMGKTLEEDVDYF